MPRMIQMLLSMMAACTTKKATMMLQAVNLVKHYRFLDTRSVACVAKMLFLYENNKH